MPEADWGYSIPRKYDDATNEMLRILIVMEVHIVSKDYNQLDICTQQMLELATMNKLKSGLEGDTD